MFSFTFRKLLVAIRGKMCAKLMGTEHEECQFQKMCSTPLRYCPSNAIYLPLFLHGVKWNDGNHLDFRCDHDCYWKLCGPVFAVRVKSVEKTMYKQLMTQDQAQSFCSG